MKRNFYLLFLLLLCTLAVRAQEKLLYSTNFQNWSALSASATEQLVTKTTSFTNEALTFKLFQNLVSPTGWDATRFTNPPASVGYIRAAKILSGATSYIITSPLKSITKVSFTHGATGNSRGYRLWKKNATDADWVALTSATAYANPAAGQTVTVAINDTDVALKFTNLKETENAYLFDLNIYGNSQLTLTTSVNIAGAGSITRTPDSTLYSSGTSVSLSATKNFGYKFIKWVDATTNADLSTANPYVVTMNGHKNIKAIFEAVNTYTFNVSVAGSNWGEVQLNPAPSADGKYEDGTEVTMKVIPNAVTIFNYWNDSSTLPERVVTVNGNKSFTATFDAIPFITGWDFKAQSPRSNRAGDFYSESTNTGLISLYESVNGATPTSVNWLAGLSAFSPAYPHLRFWSSGSVFKTTRRHLKAQLATTGYKNIQVKSMVGASYQAYSVMTLQYSLDDITYNEVARVNITDNYNASWKDLIGTLPAEAENKSKIYLRWIADATSAILNEGTTNDGTAITNVFVYADKNVTPDSNAPVLVSVVPANGSSSAPINGSVVVTFNEKVKAGTGNITLGSTTLTGLYGTKTATFKYEKLSYDTEYTFTVPAGAITDAFGNAFAGLTITFRTAQRPEPTKKLFDAVVAQDGSGDYTSVIEALAAAPTGRTQPWLIYIKNGEYTGHHDIPATKPFIHLIGQSRDNVVISDSRLSGGDNAYPVNQGATMVVNSKDVYFENLTLENSIGYDNLTGPQALALYATTDRFTTNNVWLRSYQDTYLTAYASMYDRQYLKNSKIEGAVDYIYGGGDVFFDKCTLTNNRNDGGYIVAPSHAVGTLWGYVFSNCTIDASPRIANTGSNYFGRPWHNAPKTVFLNTTLKTAIKPEGWYYKMNAIPAIFADYKTMDANGNLVDLSQRISYYEYDVRDANGNVTGTVSGTAKNSLTDAEAATYTYENVILRSGDSWDPRMMTAAPANPSSVSVNGSVISWGNAAYSRLYIVFRNNAVIGFTTNTTFTDATAVSGQTYTYGVQAVGEYGALSAATTTTSVISNTPTVALNNIDIVKDSDQKGLILYPNPVSALLQVIHPEAGRNSIITIYSLNGTRLITRKPENGSSQSSVDVSGLTPGTYILNYSGGSESFTSKFIKQ